MSWRSCRIIACCSRMAVTRQRAAAAARLDQNVRPNHPRLDMHRGDLADADAHLVLFEPRPFMPDDRLVRHLNDGGKKKIAPRPATRLKYFRSHGDTVIQKIGLINPLSFLTLTICPCSRRRGCPTVPQFLPSHEESWF